MSNVAILFVLLLAAILEAGGDALVRYGLKTSAQPLRLAIFALGGSVLFLYGYVMNTPDWDFGRLLGIYVVLFFLVAQVLSWWIFNQPPTRAVLAGGFFIVIGGIVMSVWA